MLKTQTPKTVEDFALGERVKWSMLNVVEAEVIRIGQSRVRIRDLATDKCYWVHPAELEKI